MRLRFGRICAAALLCAVALLLGACSPEKDPAETTTIDPQEETMRDTLIGANYFAGWWRATPNKWMAGGTDWRLAFPERIPTLGMYNDQPTMEAEIDVAAEYGLDFFLFLWYPVDSSSTVHNEPHLDFLNDGVDYFVNAKNSNKMKFAVEYCNHAPFSIKSEAEWLETCRLWADYMKHSSYLRVDGKAVFKIHGFSQFFEEAGGEEKAMERVETLRNVAREAGAGEILLSIGVGSQSDVRHLAQFVPGGRLPMFDFYAIYMDVPSLEAKDTDYSYNDLIELAAIACEHYGEAGLPYLPYLPAGWNPRPWGDPRPSFELPNREQFLGALNRLRSYMDKYPNLGIPGSSGTKAAMNIYAWNEFGEGGFIAPVLGGNQKLEAIKDFRDARD